jgi:hypothetical protein
MIIERVSDWDNTYAMYRASYKGQYAYGVIPSQALGNLLGILFMKYHGL